MSRRILQTMVSIGLLLTNFVLGIAQKATTELEPQIISASETLDSLVINNVSLELHGQINHDLHAVNSKVILFEGSVIHGQLLLEHSTLENRGNVDVAVSDISSISGTGQSSQPYILRTAPVNHSNGVSFLTKSWSAGQFYMLFSGMLIALVACLLFPRALQQSTAAMYLSPGYCFRVGIASYVVGYLLIRICGFLSYHFGFIFMPITVGVMTVVPTLCILGWVCGMRKAGDKFASRLGKPDRGMMLPRILCGIVGFVCINLVLGFFAPSLGAIGFLFELGFAVLGLGAIVSSGFGKDPDWLRKRMGTS